MLKNSYLNFCRYSINTYWAQFGNVFLWTAHCTQGLLSSMIHKSCWFLCFLFEGLFLLQVYCKQLLLFLQNIWCDCSVLSLQLTKASDCRKLYILLCVCVCVCVRARVRAYACMCDIRVLYGVSILNRNSSYMWWCFETGSEHAILFHRKWLWSWNQRELDIHSYCMKANCTRFYMVVLEFHISGRIFVIYLVIVPL